MFYLIEAVAEFHYQLVLNPIRSSAESQRFFGPFPTIEGVIAFYKSHLVEPYTETEPSLYNGQSTVYRKTFRKGSPLEWMNPLPDHDDLLSPTTFGHGIHEVLVDISKLLSKKPT